METTGNLAQRLMWVMWPAFLVAGVAEAIFFTVFDPFDLHFFGAPLEMSRTAIYTMGFFGFWALGIASSALTVFLERSPWEVNRCPIEPQARPEGCPKRDEDGACCAPDDAQQRPGVRANAARDRRAARGAQVRWPTSCLQRRRVEQLDRAALHLDQPFFLEPREEPAHGLELEAEVAADLLARHPQHELGGRVAAAAVAIGQVQQEHREPFLGAHAAEQQHHVVVARDLARQELVAGCAAAAARRARGPRAARTAARRPRCPRARRPGSRGARCRCRRGR